MVRGTVWAGGRGTCVCHLLSAPSSEPAPSTLPSLLLHPLPKYLHELLRAPRGAGLINHPLPSVSAQELNSFVTAALFPAAPCLLWWLPRGRCVPTSSGTAALALPPAAQKRPGPCTELFSVPSVWDSRPGCAQRQPQALMCQGCTRGDSFAPPNPAGSHHQTTSILLFKPLPPSFSQVLGGQNPKQSPVQPIPVSLPCPRLWQS